MLTKEREEQIRKHARWEDFLFSNLEMQEVLAEIDELRAKGESLCNQNGVLMVENHDLKARIDKLRDALTTIWNGTGQTHWHDQALACEALEEDGKEG